MGIFYFPAYTPSSLLLFNSEHENGYKAQANVSQQQRAVARLLRAVDRTIKATAEARKARDALLQTVEGASLQMPESTINGRQVLLVNSREAWRACWP